MRLLALNIAPNLAAMKIQPGDIVELVTPGERIRCRVLQRRGDWIEIELLAPQDTMPSSFWVQAYRLALI